MGKVKKTLLVMLSSVALISSTNAATCGYEEKAKLNNEVANIKANYEIKERILDKGEYSPPDGIESEDFVAKTDYIEVNILNITQNMYIEVSNDLNDEIKTYSYQDTKDGKISFTQNELDSLITYTIKVYASSNTGCEGTTLKTLYVALPRYNDYSTYDICSQVPDYYLCQRYVTSESVSYETFFKRINEELTKKDEDNKKKEEKNNWFENVIDFIVLHKTPFIVGGVVLVVAVSTTTIIIIKKRRRSII